MTRDGGLAEAIARRRAAKPEHESAREHVELRVLEESPEAATAWRNLSKQGGRWRVQVDPSVVLDLVLTSATLAPSRDRVPKLAATMSGRYNELIEAAASLQAHFVKKCELREHEMKTLAASRGDYGAVSMWCRCFDDVLGYLRYERDEAVFCINLLPRPGSRGPRAEARAFAYNLSTYLVRTYGRPFDSFAVRVGEVLYPAPGGLDADYSGLDPASIARQRRRETKLRAAELPKKGQIAYETSENALLDEGAFEP